MLTLSGSTIFAAGIWSITWDNMLTHFPPDQIIPKIHVKFRPLIGTTLILIALFKREESIDKQNARTCFGNSENTTSQNGTSQTALQSCHTTNPSLVASQVWILTSQHYKGRCSVNQQ